MTTLRTVVVLAGALLVAGGAVAQSASTEKASGDASTAAAASTATSAQAQAESPLVKAARDGAAKRTKKSRLSIDDKDVKKSAGKLIETTTKPLAPIPAAGDVEARLRAEAKAADAEKNAEKNAAKVFEDRVAAAQKEVDSLESELRRIEQTYYDEDDPDFREDVIEKKFEDTAAKLEKARKNLEAARNAAAARGVSNP